MQGSEITVKDLDDLLMKIRELQVKRDEAAEVVTGFNKEINTLEVRASEVLIALERDEYSCPAGEVFFEEVFNVKNPTDENKHLLWDWMKERDIFERYAQVHATSLKTLFKKELQIAMESGEGDPITFALPGMEPATIFRKIKFKAKK